MQCPRALPIILLAARLLAGAVPVDDGSAEWAVVRTLESHRGMCAAAQFARAMRMRRHCCGVVASADRDGADLETLAAFVTVRCVSVSGCVHARACVRACVCYFWSDASVPQALTVFVGRDAAPAPSALLEFFGMLGCNVFTLTDGPGTPVGIGLYPRAALVNHSCAPNCVASYSGARQSVRTVGRVAAGEELCIAYIDVSCSTVRRRRCVGPRRVRRLRVHGFARDGLHMRSTLRSQYYFSCECARCEAGGKSDDALSAVSCTACPSGVCVLLPDGPAERSRDVYRCASCDGAPLAAVLASLVAADELYAEGARLRRVGMLKNARAALVRAVQDYGVRGRAAAAARVGGTRLRASGCVVQQTRH